MRIKEEYKVREMAGEHIVVMQGRYGVDMTKVIALNETSLWLWNRLQGREFGTDDVPRFAPRRVRRGCGNRRARRPGVGRPAQNV